MSRYWNDLFVEPETEDDISYKGYGGDKRTESVYDVMRNVLVFSADKYIDD